MPLTSTLVEKASPLLTVLALVIAVTPLVAALCSPFLKRRPKFLGILTTVFSLVTLLAAALVVTQINGKAYYIELFSAPVFYLDSLSIYFVLLVNLVALFACFSIPQFLVMDARQNKNHDPGYFYGFFNLFHMTMLLVPLVNNLVLLWIAVGLWLARKVIDEPG